MATAETALPSLSVIIPAHNEEAVIGDCLAALFASEKGLGQREAIVVANGCNDRTARCARDMAGAAAEAGWDLQVLDLPKGGKPGALRAGDAAASGDILAYLDADVTVSPDVMGQLVAQLAGATPRYGSGTPQVAHATTAVTRAYAGFWTTLPFVTDDVPGFGLFAMNRAGHDRMGAWPDVISDDTFARLSFAPSERHKVAGGYIWPMVEGWANLVRVRRRQDQGVAEIRARFPALLVNDTVTPPNLVGKLGRALRDPLGFVVYVAVALTTRTPLWRNAQIWQRGR